MDNATTEGKKMKTQITDDQIISAVKTAIRKRGQIQAISEMLGCTDGTTRSRLRKLEAAGRVEITKSFTYDPQEDHYGQGLFGGAGACIRRFLIVEVIETPNQTETTEETEMMDLTNVNANEMTVLRAVCANAMDSSGGDFAFTDEVVSYLPNFGPQQVGAWLTSLQKKGFIDIDGPHWVNDEARVVQIELPGMPIEQIEELAAQHEHEPNGCEPEAAEASAEESSFAVEAPIVPPAAPMIPPSEGMKLTERIAQLEDAISLVLAIEECPKNSPDLVVLAPQTRRQLLKAIGLDEPKVSAINLQSDPALRAAVALIKEMLTT